MPKFYIPQPRYKPVTVSTGISQAKYKEACDKITSLEDQLDTQGAELNELQSKNESLIAELNELKSKFSKLSDQHTSDLSELKSTQSSLGLLQSSLLASQSAQTSLENIIKSKTNQINELETKISKLSTDISAKDEDISRYKSENSKLLLEISDLQLKFETDISAKDTEISKLSTDISAKISDKDTEISRYKSEISKLSEQNSELSAELLSLHSSLVSKEQEISNLESLNSNLRSDLSHQIEINDKIKSELSKLQQYFIAKTSSLELISNDEEKVIQSSIPMPVHDIVASAFDKDLLHELMVREFEIHVHCENKGESLTWYAALNDDYVDNSNYTADINFEFCDGDGEDIVIKFSSEKLKPIDEFLEDVKKMNIQILNQTETMYSNEKEIKTPETFDVRYDVVRVVCK